MLRHSCSGDGQLANQLGMKRSPPLVSMPIFSPFLNPETNLEDPTAPEYSPRRPPPMRPQKPINLLVAETFLDISGVVVERQRESLRELQPWEHGGIGIPSEAEPNPRRGLHFDETWRSKDVTLSPDLTSVSVTGKRYGGFALSSEPLKRPAIGRWFEVSIELTEPDRWTDGLGVGFAVASSPALRVEPDALGEVDVVQGFVSEVMPLSWMIGYDGRTKCCGKTTLLKGRHLPRGMWKPAVLEPGDTIGVLSPPDGRLMLFVNGILRYDVEGCNVPWGTHHLRAAVDLDGCTKAVHLLDSNGVPPPRVVQESRRVLARGIAGLLSREEEEQSGEQHGYRSRRTSLIFKEAVQEHDAAPAACGKT